MRRSPALLLLTIVLGACAGGSTSGSPSAGGTVRDSAGVTIIESVAPAWTDAERWAVAPEPLLRIGVADGDESYVLHAPSHVRRLSDGRVVFGNAGTELRYYDAQGRYLRTVGRRGDGPGEFRSILAIEPFCGDSLLVQDSFERLSIFDGQGGFVRTIRLSHDLPREGALADRIIPQPRPPALIGRLNDGTLLFRRYAGSHPATVDEGRYQDTVLVVHYAADGQPLHGVAALGGVVQHRVTVGARRFAFNLPFARNAVVGVHGSELFTGTQESFEVIAWSASGEPRRIIRLLRPNQPVTREDVRAFEEQLAETNRAREESGADLVTRPALPYPATMPAYGALRVDREGNLWVRAYAPNPSEETPWHVFAASGSYLGELLLPGGRFTLHEIGASHVIGVERDDLDVASIVVYDLMKPDRTHDDPARPAASRPHPRALRLPPRRRRRRGAPAAGCRR
jgi:hypothetical protein